MPGGSWFPLLIFGFFGLVALSMVPSMVSGDGPPLLFGLAWLAIVGWNAYWFLFRIAGELWVDGPLLHWRAALRSGAVALTDIERIRPMRLGSNVEVIVVRNQRPIMTMATRGIREFNDSIVRQRPDLPVRLGWNARLNERITFRSRFR